MCVRGRGKAGERACKRATALELTPEKVWMELRPRETDWGGWSGEEEQREREREGGTLLDFSLLKIIPHWVLVLVKTYGRGLRLAVERTYKDPRRLEWKSRKCKMQIDSWKKSTWGWHLHSPSCILGTSSLPALQSPPHAHVPFSLLTFRFWMLFCSSWMTSGELITKNRLADPFFFFFFLADPFCSSTPPLTQSCSPSLYIRNPTVPSNLFF